LPFRSSCKYLGVFINDHLSDDEDILRQQRSFYMRCNYLMRNFIHCSPYVKCCLFTSFCSNVYAGHCWSKYTHSRFHSITVAFNNSFRRFLGLPRRCSASGMFVNNAVRSLQEVLRKLIFNFRNRILYSDNLLIKTLFTPTIFCSSLWHHWNALLFTSIPWTVIFYSCLILLLMLSVLYGPFWPEINHLIWFDLILIDSPSSFNRYRASHIPKLNDMPHAREHF
jgi:hypothetical protein